MFQFLSFFSPAEKSPPAVDNSLVRYTKAPTPVTVDKMCDLDDWALEEPYELMIAIKPGLPIPHFSIYHVAIAFRNAENNTYAIYGRPSPYDYSTWSTLGFSFETRKYNEKHLVNENYSFTTFPVGVGFNKTEIKQLLTSADALINQAEPYSLLGSNCASYVVACNAFAIEAILARRQFNTTDVTRMISMLNIEFLTGSFKPGILNNEIIIEKLSSVFEAVRGRVELINDSQRSIHDTHLLQQVSDLIDRIKQAKETPKNMLIK